MTETTPSSRLISKVLPLFDIPACLVPSTHLQIMALQLSPKQHSHEISQIVVLEVNIQVYRPQNILVDIAKFRQPQKLQESAHTNLNIVTLLSNMRGQFPLTSSASVITGKASKETNNSRITFDVNIPTTMIT
jgi:hypothetical protein